MKYRIHYLMFFLVGIIIPGLYSQEQMEIEGAIIINNSEDPSPAPGTMRWTGTDFEGWNNQRWVSLTGYAIAGSAIDFDGNTYQTARIGNQEWMTENLRVTKYNDGEMIDEITNDATWGILTEGAWCWYNNDNTYEQPYGKLYNWFAVNTSKLCPTGWHVPSEAEWVVLLDYLGGSGVAGGRMKEAGFAQWASPNTGATNESGFTGRPGGVRIPEGSFHNFSIYGFWWSGTAIFTDDARACRLITSNIKATISTNNQNVGYSVRCVSD